MARTCHQGRRYIADVASAATTVVHVHTAVDAAEIVAAIAPDAAAFVHCASAVDAAAHEQRAVPAVDRCSRAVAVNRAGRRSRGRCTCVVVLRVGRGPAPAIVGKVRDSGCDAGALEVGNPLGSVAAGVLVQLLLHHQLVSLRLAKGLQPHQLVLLG